MSYAHLTNSLEQTLSWEADSTLIRSRNSPLLSKSKVHYRVYKSHPTVPVLSQ
jgi:hypothetical protein